MKIKFLFCLKEYNWQYSEEGFTLIELLVVVSIIGLLASILVININSARMKARDTLRRGDLTQLSKALELYYQDNGHYPTTSPSGVIYFYSEATWGGSKNHQDPNSYIPGLAPKYISVLPTDPSLNQPIGGCDPGWAGFWYAGDYTGQNYQLKAYCGAEIWPVLSTDPFYDPNKLSSYVISTPGAVNW